MGWRSVFTRHEGAKFKQAKGKVMTNLKKLGRLMAAGAAFATLIAAQPALADQTYSVNLRPLNKSGVTGKAMLTLSSDNRTLTVQIDATGLEKDQLHVGHIHGQVMAGNEPADSSIPSPKEDSDRDKFVELAEGQVTYGPVLIPLGTDEGGNLDPDGDGTIHYRQTFDLTDPAVYNSGFNQMSVIGNGGNELQLREIIIHGLTVPAAGAGTPAEVDGTAGYKTVLPVAGGEIRSNGRNPLEFRMAPKH
jgi:hypothetical protein